MGSPRRGWQRSGVVFYPVVERFLLCVDPDAHQGNEGAVAIVNFMQYEGWEWGKIAAGGTLVMLPVAVFAVFVRHYLVPGLTAGGVKE
jgi:ABC-type maltose transport system permease subunit